MKILPPLCLFLLAACGTTTSPNDPAASGGSNAGSLSAGGSGGKFNPDIKAGSGGGGASQAGAPTTGPAGGAGKGGRPATEAGGKPGEGGKGGAGEEAGSAGGSAEGGGKAGAAGGGGGGKAGTAGGSAGGKAGAAGGDAGGKTGSSGGSASGTGAHHVFLLLGQSNMAGYPKAQDADKQKNPQVQVLGFDACSATGRKSDQWDVAVPPLHECFQGAIGPGDWFAKTIISKYPAGDTVWLVPGAFSGEKIATLSKGGSHWDAIIRRAKMGQEKGPIEGMLFHQGESDCGNSQWPANVKSMYTQLKEALSLTQDVPFLAGELPPTSACSNHNPLVNQLPTVMGSYARVISSKDLKIDAADTQWNMHFDHDSQVTFGKRYAESMITALGL